MFGGSSTYSGPKYLMDRDIVFVTFNYRLGPFGNYFLDLKKVFFKLQWGNKKIQ